METSVFGIYLALSFILVGAVLLFFNRKDSAKLYSIIRYEIPAVLLFPVALFCLGIKPFSDISYIICVLFGFSPWVYILMFLLLGACASASVLIKSGKGFVFGFCGAALLFAYDLLFFKTDFSLLIALLLYGIYLLLLCGMGLHLEKNQSETFVGSVEGTDEQPEKEFVPMASATADTPKPENNKRSTNAMEQKIKPGSALRRGIIGASAGAALMLIFSLFIGFLDGGDELKLYHLFYFPFCGMLYGFGFAFANWRKLLKSVRRGAVEGTAGLGIGLILAHLTDNKNWGLWGWMFFVFRLIFSFAFGWIPGIWYGIKAIYQELKENSASAEKNDFAPQTEANVADTAKPTEPVKHLPVLTCLSGTFAGAEFPLNGGEVITVGSDPSRCQIVLFGEDISSEHCRIMFSEEENLWYAADLSGGKTYRDGIRPLANGNAVSLPRGTVLSLGSGQSAQRFKLM